MSTTSLKRKHRYGFTLLEWSAATARTRVEYVCTRLVVRRPHGSPAPRITPGHTVGPPWPHRQMRTGGPGNGPRLWSPADTRARALKGPANCGASPRIPTNPVRSVTAPRWNWWGIDAAVRQGARQDAARPGASEAQTRAADLEHLAAEALARVRAEQKCIKHPRPAPIPAAGATTVGGQKPRSHGAATVAAPCERNRSTTMPVSPVARAGTPKMVGASIANVILARTSNPKELPDLTTLVCEQTTTCLTTAGDQGTAIHGAAVPHHPASHAGWQPGKIKPRLSRRRARASRRWQGSPSRCGGCSAGW